ncbi:RE1-silencing transcription factor [Coregonus clupeaformis]|uniref:RE1-silencing transcription factor n=1 Tax=Coregonus clupeaformis TaxID=59861 RepID=UPI001BDF8F9E|nr:RE1-silencing transcription factor [Coregonus clupeaformis]XP_041707294.1 RE1-silencing transcription factor [Coregonus clupeaformis]XP_041707301.1 RE1-silencing transcription factor [Coregonus clupeaformis]XP_045063483.1 RE1-silencing transcription factor [Coregonus clupeaformis]
MASQTVYPMGLVMYSTSAGMPMVEDAQGLAELPHNELPAPQLVMLANVACENPTEGKEMMELQTVGSYSDSEDENIIRYSYDSHEREMCIVDYPESPQAGIAQVEEIDNDEEEEGMDLSKPSEQRPSSPPIPFTPSTPLGMIMESAKKKKPFFCKPCNYQAQREEEFVTHIQIHSANRMIVVKRVEGDKARAKETLAGPVQESESGDGGANNKGVIRCERCGYNTNRYDHYMAHLKHHEKEGDDQRVYKCTICTYTTVSQYHWRKHLRNHFPSKLFTCNQCCYFSDRKNNYVQHIRTHTGERPFRCPYCEYSSSQKTHLTRHMRTHSGERPFKCDRCNYLAANQHEVTRHSRQVHNGPKPLCCPHCPYKTADRSNYKKHVELHLNPRQFLCPVCKYAASKKCNLQYHIKSRHPGCPQIAMDVSKVKLRVKKPDSDEFTDEYTMVNGIAKFELSAIDDEEEDMEARPEISGADKQSSHGNLSTKKSSNPSPLQAAESVATDKTHKKCYVSPVKETPKKAKDKAEKKVTLKRKSTEMSSENTKQNVTPKETAAAVQTTGNKVKRCPKKQTIGKTGVQDKSKIKETVERVQKVSLEEDDVEKEKSVKEALEKDMLEKENKEENKRLEKEKKEQQGTLKNEREGKENKNTTKSKSPSKKMEKVVEKTVEKAPQSLEAPVEKQGEKSKMKPLKRKAAEALDLSMKESPEEPCTDIKAKRLKVKAAHKSQSKASIPQSMTTEPCPVSEQEASANQIMNSPVVKKLKNINKKEASPGETEASSENKECSIIENPISPPENKKCPATELQPTVVQGEKQASDQETVPAMHTSTRQSSAEQQSNNGGNNLAKQNASPSQDTTPQAEQAKVADQAEETPTLEDESPSPIEMDGSPDFRRPQGEPSTPTTPSLELPRPRGKPTETEEDEGIHSHDGGSEISDSASEGSDDSGLNGLAAAASKLANDPETPTEEIPTPTELKNHMCIFCDRTFPLEVEYRRHLNRHLVNVYYLDNASKLGQ